MKKILVLSRRMDIGGVEISLLNFLKILDYEQFKVTLLLQEKKGELLGRIPEPVIVKEMQFQGEEYLKLVQLDMKLPVLKEIKFKLLAVKCKKKKSEAPFFYEALKHCFAELEEYDLAIDYHGYGYFSTIFMLNKVRARKYATFIHDDKIDWMNNIKSNRNKIDYYFCVSKACADHIVKEFPELSGKTEIFHNIVDEDNIVVRSKEVQTDISDDEKNVLVTVGRLEWQKGYDFLLDVAELLKSMINFKWYIVGTGSWRERLETDICEKGLSDYVFLLGAKENPYPYIKRADVYVQTSRHEGYGLAVCEARVLGKPIISTDLPCIREQMCEYDGCLCSFDKEQFAECLETYLKREKVSFNETAEIELVQNNQMNRLKEIIYG